MSDTSNSPVVVQRDGAVGVATLKRPDKRNALDLTMRGAIAIGPARGWCAVPASACRWRRRRRNDERIAATRCTGHRSPASVGRNEREQA